MVTDVFPCHYVKVCGYLGLVFGDNSVGMTIRTSRAVRWSSGRPVFRRKKMNC